MEIEGKQFPKGRVIVLACILILSLGFFVFMRFVYVPDGQVRLRLNGRGTEDRPYLIKTAEDLEHFAQSVNGGNDHKGKYFLMENDIVLAGLMGDSGWRPIGNYGREFRGVFDGGGYTVRGFWVDTNGPANIGFFGYIDDGAILNLNVSGSVKGKLYAGLLVGYMNGGESRIVNCTATGDVQVTQLSRGDDSRPCVGGLAGVAYSGRIENCSASVDVTVWGEDRVHAGGLAGDTDIGIINCRADGNVAIYEKDNFEGEASYFIAGGLAGYSRGNLTGCQAYGNVTVRTEGSHMIFAGGLTGRSNAGVTVRYCSAAGGISVYGKEETFLFIDGEDRYSGSIGSVVTAGGLIGTNWGDVYDCHASGNVYVEKCEYAGIGGLIGWSDGLTGRCYSVGKTEASASLSSIIHQGGLMGILKEKDDRSVMQNCYFDSQITEQEMAFNMPDSDGAGQGAQMGRTTAEMQTRSTYEGWDFENIWAMPESGGLPYLR